MKLYLVRHGETNWNVDKKVQGPISSTLTENGLLQARQVRQYFNDNGIIFEKVFYSPTIRTQQTLGEIIPEYLNCEYVFETKEIEERHHVDIVGLTKNEIEARLRVEFTQRFSWELYFEGTDKSLLTNKFSNNETLESVRNRIKVFCESLFDLKQDSVVLIVGHSVINQYLLEFLKFRTIGENRFDDFQKNNEIRKINLDGSNQFESFEKIFL